jgi:cell division septal protein FtsQ
LAELSCGKNKKIKKRFMTVRRFRKPYRIRKKKSIFRNRFFWLTLLILILLGGALYLLLFSSYLQIKQVQISGNQKIKTRELEYLIEQKINKKIFTSPTRSIILVNLKDIEESIVKNFPLISQANLERNLPDALTLKVEERMPIFVWSKDSGPLFYVDKEGIAFEELSEDSSLLRIRDQQFKLGVNLGEKVMEKEMVDFAQQTKSEIEKKIGVFPKEILILEDRITVLTNEPWQIYLDLKEKPEKQIFNLSLAWEKEIPPEKRGNLEYIDLRFGNRVYYKYR